MISPKDFQQKWRVGIIIEGRKDQLVDIRSQLDMQGCKVEVIKKMEKVEDVNEEGNTKQ